MQQNKNGGSIAQQMKNGGEDRLSELPDDILGHILSFLPTNEAGRAAVLSTRWRYVFASVHTLSFQDTRGYNFWGDTYTFYADSVERRSVNGCFIDDVNAALLCRRRCVGLARDTSLRSFSVGINYFYNWDRDMVQKWLSHALQQSGSEFHLDLRLHHHQRCELGGAPSSPEYDERERRERGQQGWSLWFPRSLFSCVALRSLRVGHCWLHAPPEEIALPSLETLHLTNVGDSEDEIHRLIASCPRLDDLMIQSCSKVTRLSVPADKRLRRFSLRCCHHIVRVTLNTSELRVLDYRGTVPAQSLFTFHGSLSRISSCTIDFCGPSLSSAEELAGFRKFLENFVPAKHLHLLSRRLGCSIESEFFTGFPLFSSLHKLELTGCLDNQTTVCAVPRILQRTPNLEVLTLFLTPVDKESSSASQLVCNLATIPDAPECLRQQLREINLVHYQGTDEQRMLAKLLLGNALLLEALCVVLPKATLELQTRLMNDIKQWVVSKSTKMTFL